MVRRIVVKGASGAGKSTMARELARRLGLRYLELDALHHGPNWNAASAAELRSRVRAALDGAEGWIVDGNYDSKLGSMILDQAELVIWLDLPLHTKLTRLVCRTAGRWLTNEELWSGNRETLKAAFWGEEALFPLAVRSHFRHRRRWPALLEGRALVRLRGACEAERWLEGVAAHGLDANPA